MTITLTTEELSTLCAQLQEWYDRRSLYVLKHIRLYPMRMSGASVGDEWMMLTKEFEEENPRPDWKSYL